MKTQHQKIIEMCNNDNWHCQVEFWNNYIRSPHKRRSEIEQEGIYKFEWQKCKHGHAGVRDYKMIKLDNEKPAHQNVNMPIL